MKKLLLTIIIAVTAISAYAQPRAAGLRMGVCGFEADYQHTFVKNQFLETSLGVDFGYNVNAQAGIKATATYNFIWARPAWTEAGSWALYAGPGATIGYVNDDVHYMTDDGLNLDARFQQHGFMLGICAQVGLEYTFWFPLQLSFDLRPVFGMHVNKGYSYPDAINPEISHTYASKTSFYDNGLLGFAPSLSIRYRF